MVPISLEECAGELHVDGSTTVDKHGMTRQPEVRLALLPYPYVSALLVRDLDQAPRFGFKVSLLK